MLRYIQIQAQYLLLMTRSYRGYPLSSTFGVVIDGRSKFGGRWLLWLAMYSKICLMFLAAIWSRFHTFLQFSHLSNA